MSPTASRSLTRREGEVLELIAQGLTNGEVARRLDVTVHAVKFHLASIYKKLGVANRTEAAGVFFHERARQPKPPATSTASAVDVSEATNGHGPLLAAFAVVRRYYGRTRRQPSG